MVKKVVIEGGPCSGKSTFLKRAIEMLQKEKMSAFLLSEGATDFIESGLTPRGSWKDELAFQRHILINQLSREQNRVEALKDLNTPYPKVLLCDRGSLGGIAYVKPGMFSQVLKDVDREVAELYAGYAGVVHLVTAAIGAEAHYTCENNKARTETVEQARELDLRTRAAWVGHPHFAIIDNSTDFETKMVRALNALRRFLHMPVPLEKERKFIIRNFTPNLLPSDASKAHILQAYLKSGDDTERRVRKVFYDGSRSYYYTEKRLTYEDGVREENEEPISEERFIRYMTYDYDPETRTIIKERYSFVFGGRKLEVDVYGAPSVARILGLAVLEIEVPDMRDTIEFPPNWDLKEVTHDKRFSNKAIASGSLNDINSLDLI